MWIRCAGAPGGKTVKQIFVYGTLMRGMEHGDLLARRRDAKYVGPAACRGTLWDLGENPGMTLEGKGNVSGELFRSDVMEEILRSLDAFESGAGFERHVIQVRFRQSRTEAWAYIYGGPLQGLTPILSGSWKDRVKRLAGRGKRF